MSKQGCSLGGGGPVCVSWLRTGCLGGDRGWGWADPAPRLGSETDRSGGNTSAFGQMTSSSSKRQGALEGGFQMLSEEGVEP